MEIAAARWMRSYFAAIGDQDLFKHRSYWMTIIGSPNSTGWPSSIDFFTAPLRRLDRVHHLHRFDDHHGLAWSPCRRHDDAWAPGSGFR
jgi:hypothetical protein